MKKVLLIGGSAGGFQIVVRFLQELPEVFNYSVVLCMHRLRTAPDGLCETLASGKKFLVKEAYDKERIMEGIVYLAPANYHLLADYFHRFSLSTEKAFNHSRPSLDITMESFAEVFKERLVAVLLSGANTDGAKGMQKVSLYGGETIVQNPSGAEIKTMPESALKLFKPDRVLETSDLIRYMAGLVS